MRRALGIDRQSSPSAEHYRPPPAPSRTHRGQHRFVRDGEVPVVIRNQEPGDCGARIKLDQAQQALREQIEAREQVERQLRDALVNIEHLQTQLAHEQIAREEALQRAEAARRQIEQALDSAKQELAGERQARQAAEQERDDAIVGRQEAEERLRAALAAQRTQEPRGPAAKAKRAVRAKAGSVTTGSGSRPPEIDEPEAGSEFVECWKQGWRDRRRSSDLAQTPSLQAAAMSRVTLIGSLSVRHRADRLASRGRQ